MTRVFTHALLALFLFLSMTAHAGGILYLDEEGTVFSWEIGAAVQLHPESGTCAGFTNPQMITKLETLMAQWTDHAEIDLTIDIVTGQYAEIDESNYEAVIAGAPDDALNPVTFDQDGDLIASLYGAGNRELILGYAELLGNEGTRITSADILINCACLDNHPDDSVCVDEITESTVDAVIVHETGHLLNLDHSQVNLDLTDSADPDDLDMVPTMFPVSVDAAGQLTPSQDDIVALASVYPSGSFENDYCEVVGALVDAAGEPLRCADLQAIADDAAENVAFVTGALAPAIDGNNDSDTQDDGECQSDCGAFRLFLKPGIAYALTTREINGAFVDGSGLSPCYHDQLETVEEEVVSELGAATCVAGSQLNLGTLTATLSTASGGGGGGEAEDGLDQEAADAGKRPVTGCALGESAAPPTGFISVIFLVAVFVIAGLALRVKAKVAGI